MSPEPDGSSALRTLQILVGLLAGAAALVYVTGGIVLGFRLGFAGLPVLGVVAQLPREFLFSIGFGLIVAPALLFGVVAGLVEHRDGTTSLEQGHVTWAVADGTKRRRAYLAFCGAMAVVLVAPGFIVAVARDADLQAERGWIIGLTLFIAGVALAIWVALLRGDLGAKVETRTSMLLAGMLPAVGFGLVFWFAFEHREPLPGRYFGLTLASLIALLTGVLVVWIRGKVGETFRDGGPHSRGALVALTAVSWAASTLLAVPALVAVAAALPLEEVAVCWTPRDDSAFEKSGHFVGDTTERVYLGAGGRIVAYPADNVTRIVIGGTSPPACPPAPKDDRPEEPTTASAPDPPAIAGFAELEAKVDPAGRFLVHLQPFDEEVTGVVQLVSVKERLKLSTHAFRADPGAKVAIRFALSEHARKALRDGKLEVWARITARGMTGAADTKRTMLTIA